MTVYSATSGSPVNNTTLQSGDTLTVSSGGTATMNVLSGGSMETVLSGGAETSTMILSGATAFILGSSAGGVGGTASGDSIYGTVTVSGTGTGNPSTATNAQVTNETVYSGGQLNLLATGALATGTTVNGGALYVSKSGVLSNTTIENGGTVTLNSAKALLTGSVTFSGTGNSLVFQTLTPNQGGSAYGDLAPISGFAPGDILDARPLSGGTLGPLTTNSAGNTVATISGTVGGAAATQSFILAGDPSNYSSLAAMSDGAGGTELVEPAVCFASGTQMRTTRGDIAVETLLVGDVVITSSGEHRPIRWLGHRTMDCRRYPDPQAVMPVRITAHAFGPNRPARDLYVSPGHAICLDVVGEVLIPAIALVNDATIAQVEVDEITYWHVELDSHDVILAENLPCETYLDMGNRAFFAENDVVILDATFETSPDVDPALRIHPDYCRPFHLNGPIVDVVRAKMRARALALGWHPLTTLEAPIELEGMPPVARWIKLAVTDTVVRSSAA